jgi:hypothetical protein
MRLIVRSAGHKAVDGVKLINHAVRIIYSIGYNFNDTGRSLTVREG